ncbi:Per1-like protein [Wolfiporia cocos MD-104 SS10]|uniref:Post-GPI attachment to proteins factor 3 n=1 Tax=Wolfiporia cocos (strain MD-104) TaxID=742152 RepID=A0A2H3JAL3_WOLCO|nr:Per1-like protein [Wolfiporia cocos MD-104 SS10]
MRSDTRLLAWITLALVAYAYASSGDRAENYQRCVADCESLVCRDSTWANSLSYALRLTRWTCTDDCKYGCMHAITDHAVQNALPIQQYHGKWPFWRLAGMQEPASVFFSLLNLLCHTRGARRVRRTVPDSHPMKGYYLRFAYVSVNAWVWSAVFHTRDLPTTEKLDYFSAALAILYALYYTAIRLFHLYPAPRARLTSSISPAIRSRTCIAWTALCALAYIAHVSYLTLLPRFDYTYNMAFNLAVGMTHNLLWLAYSFPAFIPLFRRFPARPRSYRPPYASGAAGFVLLTTLATTLELFDFPPWGRVIDAHSLWHLATVPIAVFWYEFLILDALDEGWREQKS